MEENSVLMSQVDILESQEGYQIILQEKPGSKEYFTMLIGPAEFAAIAKEKGVYKTPRPLTHDMYLSILGNLKVKFLKIEIYDQKDNSYIADVVYEETGKEVRIDSRPSDALALALNQHVPILVNKKLLRTKMTREEMDFFNDIVKVVKFKGGEQT